MYRWGHYGVALVVYAPVGAALTLAGRETAAGVALAAMLALSMTPDLDLKVPLLDHRGPTHTLGFALLVALGSGAGAFALARELSVADPDAAAGLGALVGFLAILSHLAADVITPKGVAPLWPLSRRRYSLRVCRADNAPANHVLLALGVGVSLAWYAAVAP